MSLKTPNVAGVVDLPLNLLGEKTPTIYCQVLIFVDKFCWFFFHQIRIGILKNICSKNLM